MIWLIAQNNHTKNEARGIWMAADDTLHLRNLSRGQESCYANYESLLLWLFVRQHAKCQNIYYKIKQILIKYNITGER